VTRGDVVASGALAAVAVAALAALHRPLLVVGFDRTTARSFGRVRRSSTWPSSR
jgi:ABC-type Mn2+/Zn2+ transport system permease subunit